jgi:hypothetical protein
VATERQGDNVRTKEKEKIKKQKRKLPLSKTQKKSIISLRNLKVG